MTIIFGIIVLYLLIGIIFGVMSKSVNDYNKTQNNLAVILAWILWPFFCVNISKNYKNVEHKKIATIATQMIISEMTNNAQEDQRKFEEENNSGLVGPDIALQAMAAGVDLEKDLIQQIPNIDGSIDEEAVLTIDNPDDIIDLNPDQEQPPVEQQEQNVQSGTIDEIPDLEEEESKDE